MDQQETIQFEKADFGAAGASVACGRCTQTIQGSYFQRDGGLFCASCKETLSAEWHAGSSLSRFSKATLLGAAGGALGAIVWYAIREITNYEIGIIAIGVGVLVGLGVKKGSSGRGGWKYQALAMAITYTSICSTYVPVIVRQMLKTDAATAATAPGATPPAGTAAPSKAEPAEPRKPVEAPTDAGGKGLHLGDLALAVAALFGLALALPFLQGFENVIGIFIIGVGVYEAWKINKRQEMEFLGPFEVVPAPASEAKAGPAAPVPPVGPDAPPPPTEPS